MDLEVEEFNQWMREPTTQVILKFLKDYRLSILDQWAEGKFSHPSLESGALLNCEAISKAQAYGDLSEISFQDIKQFYTGDESDDKQ